MSRGLERWAVAAVLALPLAVQAEAGDWEVSLGLMSVNADMDSPVLGVDASDRVTPVINASYFVTRHIALNTAAGIARHRFSLGGATLGRASMAPLNLVAQWHFLPEGRFRPYVGVGVHHTLFFDQEGPVFDQLARFKSDTGLVLQAGASWSLSDRYFINVNYKKFYLETDVRFSGAPTRVERIGLDPDVFSLAFGMRF